MTPLEIARWHVARKTRWEHQARGDQLDCIGLLVAAFPWLQDCTDYARDPSDNRLERHLEAQFGLPIDPAGMAPGDVVALAMPTVVRHVGILGDYPLGGLSLIHTSGTTKHVTEHRLDQRWARRIRFVYRMEVA